MLETFNWGELFVLSWFAHWVYIARLFILGASRRINRSASPRDFLVSSVLTSCRSETCCSRFTARIVFICLGKRWVGQMWAEGIACILLMEYIQPRFTYWFSNRDYHPVTPLSIPQLLGTSQSQPESGSPCSPVPSGPCPNSTQLIHLQVAVSHCGACRKAETPSQAFYIQLSC